MKSETMNIDIDTEAAEQRAEGLFEKMRSALRDVSKLGVGLPEREKLVGDWFAQGDYGIIFAMRGVGKTWLAGLLAACLSAAKCAGPWRITTPRKVLYIDGEMPADMLASRLRGLGADEENLVCLNHQHLFEAAECDLNIADPDHQAALTLLIEDTQAGVVFLDNRSTLTRGMEENSNDDWEMVLSWLLAMRRRNTSVVLIEHANKGGGCRGGSRKEDATFWIMELTGDKDDDDRGAKFTSSFSKPSRNTAEPCPPIKWSFQTDGFGRVAVEFTENARVQKLVDLVESGFTSCSAIAKELQISPGQVSKKAKIAAEAKLIRIQGKNYLPGGLV
jgi:hypothetical protein